MSSVVGLILAAGESKRMGEPKPLLEVSTFAWMTLLEDQVKRLKSAGITHVYVVIGCHKEKIIERHKDLNVEWIENNDWELGNFSSVQSGISQISNEHDGLILIPIDTVFVEPETIKTIINAGLENTKTIIPVFNNQGGHPVYMPRSLFKIITSASRTEGRLDHILRNSEHLRLEVTDPNVLNNINSKNDLAGFVANAPRNDFKKQDWKSKTS